MEKPSKERLNEAADTIKDYVEYLKETEPYATNSINILEQAIFTLTEV